MVSSIFICEVKNSSVNADTPQLFDNSNMPKFHGLRVFDVQELDGLLGGGSTPALIAEGRQAKIYEGKLSDGSSVAVKIWNDSVRAEIRVRCVGCLTVLGRTSISFTSCVDGSSFMGIHAHARAFDKGFRCYDA